MSDSEARDDRGRWTGSELTPRNDPKTKRIAQLQAERMAESRGERVAGHPARLFADIASKGASIVLRGIKKGIPGAPSLVHTPGPGQLAAGGKKRRKYLHRANLFQKAFNADEPRDNSGRWVAGGIAAVGAGVMAHALIPGKVASRHDIRSELMAHGAATGNELGIKQDAQGRITGRVRGNNARTRVPGLFEPKTWFSPTKTLFHNHPGAVAPPSTADLIVAAKHPNAQNVVYASDGSVFHYSVSSSVAPNIIRNVKAAAWAAPRAANIATPRSLRLQPDEESFVVHHAANQALHDAGLIQYKSALGPEAARIVESSTGKFMGDLAHSLASIATGVVHKDLGVNGVHADAELKVRKKPVLSFAYGQPRKTLFAKVGDPYHDEGGQFTSADAAVDPVGSRENRKPQQSGSQTGYTLSRAGGEAVGSVGGSVAGQAIGAGLGGLLGSAIPIPLVGTIAGETLGGFVGRFAGGLAGDFVGRKIAETIYGAANPNFKPNESATQEQFGSLGGLAGFAAGAALGPAAGVGRAVSMVLGQTAGDVAGTRFGGYVTDRVQGVMDSTASDKATADPASGLSGTRFGSYVNANKDDPDANAGWRYGIDAATDLGADLISYTKRDKMVASNDLNDALRLKEAPAANRFRNVLLSMDAEGRAKAAALASYRPEAQTALRPRPGEPYQVFHQRIVRTVAEQQAPSFLPGGKQRAPQLFPKKSVSAG